MPEWLQEIDCRKWKRVKKLRIAFVEWASRWSNALLDLDAIAVGDWAVASARGERPVDAGWWGPVTSRLTPDVRHFVRPLLLAAGQLGGQLLGVVHLAQRLDDAGRVDRQSAGLLVAVGEIKGQ